MDETTFQHELIQLKNRVSQMASTYYRLPFAPSTPPTMQDAFAQQLDDVKTRLQVMQSSLGHIVAERSQRAGPRLYRTIPVAETPLQNTYSSTSNSRFALPSGPLFWQLFTSLRSDVRGLDHRVAALELDFSDLEDRVDGLDPSNNTPEASVDEGISFQRWTQNIPPESYQDIQSIKHSRPATDGKFYDRQPYLDDSPYRNKSVNILSEGNANVSPSAQQGAFPTPQGVAFRDREIAQLEELIRRTQDDLRQTEDLVTQKDAQLEQLNGDRQSKDSRITELAKVSAEREKIAQAYQNEFRQLQATLRSKDMTLQTRTAEHQAMQQSFGQAQSRIQQLEQTVKDVRSTEKHKMEQLIAGKDSEINKLHSFCKAKNVVVSEQEQIISRGALIIGEREKEIERLSRQLKSVIEDHRKERHEKERISRQLAEHDEEIKRLQLSLTQALMPKQVMTELRPASSTDVSQPRDGESLIRCSPFATAGTPGPRKSPNPKQWTPQAIKKYARLPHEQARASAWSPETTSQPRYSFGVPGVASQPAEQHLSKGEEQRRDLRRSDSLKLLRRLALAEEGASLPAQTDKAEGTDRCQRRRLPLDSVYQPPLPAPLPPTPPRKTASLADLSARRSDEFGLKHQQPISKHQSYQDLPRRKLQPYVEEGEQSPEE